MYKLPKFCNCSEKILGVNYVLQFIAAMCKFSVGRRASMSMEQNTKPKVCTSGSQIPDDTEPIF